MDGILEVSQRVKVQADELLRASGVLEILQEYGEVKIGGSYTLDCMLRPDIDIFVIVEKHNYTKVLEIQRRLMETKFFRELDFVNWVDFSDSEIMDLKEYYFQPWVPFQGMLWKMDISIFTREYDQSAQLTEHFKELLEQDHDGKKRLAILTIKQAMREGKKYKKGVDGKRIYKAVLEEGIMTPENFEQNCLDGN